MIHLNGNILCAIDVETTGLNPFEHEIWQIAILPLDFKIQPVKNITPFYMELKPFHPERADPKAIRREDLVRACTNGIDQFVAADLLDDWFKNKLNLPFEKKICPLAQNWPFDKIFLMRWLGVNACDLLFHPWYRDTMCASLYANDRADVNVEQIPYPKSNLAYLCSQLKVENVNPHDALSDCMATAEVYRRMLKQLF